MDFEKDFRKLTPPTQELVLALILDVWPSDAVCVAFGIETTAHLGALQYALKYDGVTLEKLDEAWGSEENLKWLVGPGNPYHGVRFHIDYDAFHGARPKTDETPEREDAEDDDVPFETRHFFEWIGVELPPELARCIPRPAEGDPGSTEGANSCEARPMPEPTPERRPNEEEPGEPERLDTESLFGEVIFAYTRKEAVADGVLVDVTETAREAGFHVPVAVTRAVWAEYVAVPEGVEAQDEAGRLWDILWMCRFGVGQGKNRDASEVLFQLHVRNDNREGVPPLVTLKAVCGPDDDGSPCITVMLPDED